MSSKEKHNLGIYVHVPFCVKRCAYCGFYSNALCGGRDEIKAYFGAMDNELEVRGRAVSSSYFVDSVYFGGGTPSLSDPELIKGFIARVGEIFEVSDDTEISMEVNPGTVTFDSLSAYRDAGVNRLSIGVQSLDDGILKKLGRIHDSGEAVDCFRMARDAGFDNVSMDLMFAVPGMTMDIWEDTLRMTAAERPDHISLYSLQIEEGTPFYDAYKRGELEQVRDEDDRDMYHTALDMLAKRGFTQYEISNTCMKGKECRHNMKYWTFSDYLGIGASASSFLSGTRSANVTESYVETANAPEGSGALNDLYSEYHENSVFDNMSEYVFTGLRLNRGVDLDDFLSRFGREIEDAFPGMEKELAPFYDGGYIKKDAGRLFLTEKGFDISNKIMQVFV